MARHQKIVIAFDFDGTIVDTARESFHSSAKAYEEMTGKDVDNKNNENKYVKGRAYSLNAESNYTLIKLIAENPALDFSSYTQKDFDENSKKNKKGAEVFVPLFRKHRAKGKETKEWFESQPMFPGIIETINELATKYIFYIATTKEKDSVVQILEYYKIDFDEEKIVSDHFKETKEELLKQVAQIEKVPVSSIVLFDDALKQLIEAKKVGAKVVLAMWGEKRQNFIDEAKKLEIQIAYSPEECIQIAKEINNFC